MKETKTFELSAAEAALIARAIDLAGAVTEAREADSESLPSGVNTYAIKGTKAETLKRLSWKIYANQVTGATITMVNDTEL